ncbi:hypothetical protein Tco_0157688 [Tanacetum coccineum]
MVRKVGRQPILSISKMKAASYYLMSAWSYSVPDQILDFGSECKLTIAICMGTEPTLSDPKKIKILSTAFIVIYGQKLGFRTTCLLEDFQLRNCLRFKETLQGQSFFRDRYGCSRRFLRFKKYTSSVMGTLATIDEALDYESQGILESTG